MLVDFKRALDEVLIDLAQLLARDGEGATKFVTINVGGASSNGAARKIGLSVANSPLVKTAIAGEDANWGRIVMAVGKSGERADRDKLRISIGGVRITDGGQVAADLRRGAGGQAPQGHRHRDRHRSRHRPRPRHGLDLRSDARLHRHQRQLPFLSAAFDEECPGGPPPLGDRPLVLVAAVALVDADGRVLIAQRPAGKSMAGLWEFPGGKVDPGETPEQALVRELHEELGIETATSCLAPIAFASHGYETFHLLMPVFACRKWNGLPRPREGQALKWVMPGELGALPHAAGRPAADRRCCATFYDGDSAGSGAPSRHSSSRRKMTAWTVAARPAPP